MTTLTITHVRYPADLLDVYPGQDAPQGAFIALDLWRGRMCAATDSEIGNAVPMDVWHGIVRRYSIGPILADAVNAMMDTITAHAQTVLDHAEIVWDGNNNIGRLHLRDCADRWRCECPAVAAEREIEREINSLDPVYDGIHWSDAADWLWEIKAELTGRLRAGTDTATLAGELDGDGTRDDLPVLIHLDRYLESLYAEIAVEVQS